MTDTSLRVLIDGALVAKQRGLGRYTLELLNALATHPNHDLRILVALRGKGTKPPIPATRYLSYVQGPNLPLPIWEQLVIPALSLLHRADVVHSPYNTKPLIFNLLSMRHVVTLHDLMFMRNGGASLYQRFGNFYRRAVVRSMFRGPMRLITDSLASAERICFRFKRTPVVIPISVEYLLRDEPISTTGRIAFERRAQPERYFLHVGGIAPHKNSQRIINAFLEAPLPDHRLVVLGMPHDSHIAKAYTSDRIIFPGEVSNQEMISYIRGAEAMAFISKEEGFGLPIIEAMSLGCPLITSNIAPMSDLAGPAAILVDPESSADIRDAFLTIASNSAVRDSLSRNGLERAPLYSAKAMADLTSNVYLCKWGS